MRALLVRHARAGKRAAWTDDDRLRPLDGKGRRQAKALAEILAGLGTEGLLSSPYLRCVETLEPAAALLGSAVETRDELAEGASADSVIGLLDGLERSLPALCTHGDVIDALLPGRECKKGAVWLIELRSRRVQAVRYLRPPA